MDPAIAEAIVQYAHVIGIITMGSVLLAEILLLHGEPTVGLTC